MSVVRPNECPRCGYAHSAWATPRAPFGERMAVSMRYRHGLFGLGAARATMELEKMPWTCRCGTRLRRKSSRYGAVDAIGIAVIGVAYLLAVVLWPPLGAWRIWPLAIPLGAWVVYRTHIQFAIEEVTDEGQRRAA